VLVKVFEKNSKAPLYEKFILLEAFLSQIVSKLALSLVFRYDLSAQNVLSIDSFIENALLYYTHIYYKKKDNQDNTLYFSFLPRPIGCCPYKIIELRFLNCLCTVDILALSQGIAKYFIYNTIDGSYLVFDVFMDESSFNRIFQTIGENFNYFSDEVNIASYRLSDIGLLQGKNLFPLIFSKIQDIFVQNYRGMFSELSVFT
jgi:hypothetical protein